MRLNTIIYLCLGSILTILLLVSLTAFYQTRKTNQDLNLILDEHIPALKILLQNQELLSKTNLAFVQYANVKEISLDEALDPVRHLSSAIQQIEKSTSSSRIRSVDDVKQLFKTIHSLANYSGNPEVSLALIEKHKEVWADIQHTISQLRGFLREWSQDEAFRELIQGSEQRLQTLSNLLNMTETNIDHYFSQAITHPINLLNPLNKCLKNLQQLDKTASTLTSTFSLKDKKNMVHPINEYP